MRVSWLFFTLAAGICPATTLSFNELQGGEDVLEFYNGGFGGAGSGAGPNFGVSFTPGALAQPPDVYGFPGGLSVAFSSVTMNVHSGWTGLFSFYHWGDALNATFYTGESGTGTMVGSFALGSGIDAFGGDFASFHSVVLNSSSTSRIDAVTFGNLVIPEPASLSLGILGIVLLAYIRRGAAGSISWGREI